MQTALNEIPAVIFQRGNYTIFEFVVKIKMFTRQSLMDFGLEKESILPAQKMGHKVVDKGDSPNRRKKDIQ